MKNIVQLIREHKFTEIGEQIDNSVPLIMEKKLLELKKAVAAKMCEQMKSASQKIRGELTEDEIEESIDPTEIHNGPAPKGQRVNRDDKDDKQPPNTTVVPKNNLKEEGEEDRPHKLNALRKLKDAEVTRKVNTLTDIKNTINSTDKALGVLGVKNNLADSDKIQSQIDLAKKTRPYNEETEEEELDEARINLIRARIRGGKIQRRKRVSNVPGMTLRGGTLKRMSAAERRRRKMGARKGKMKRRAKLSRSLMKRKRSLQKRKSLGL